MKHDCKNCPIRDLLDSAFKTVCTRVGYDTTCTDHCCGCLEYFEYDDTPGYREKYRWYHDEKCILKDRDESYPLPLYKGTYEDLLKTH